METTTSWCQAYHLAIEVRGHYWNLPQKLTQVLGVIASKVHWKRHCVSLLWSRLNPQQNIGCSIRLAVRAAYKTMLTHRDREPTTLYLDSGELGRSAPSRHL